jgi:hypothetical protein
MGSKLYSVPFAGVAVTAQQDFFEVTAAAGKPLIIHSIEIEQSTEVGDAQEEGLSILLKRGTSATTSGTGGTQAITCPPVLSSDSAFGGTADINNTTKMTGGTITTLRAWNWNVRIPFFKIFTPETRPIVAGGERLTVELATTPADSITISGTMLVEELG